MTARSLIIEYESMIRLAAFLGILFTVAAAEVVVPRRQLTVSKLTRWFTNLTMVFLNSAVLRLVFPVLAVGVAAAARDHGWGLLNAVAWPIWVEVAAAVLILDAVIYAQHRIFHAVPVLWRFHQMHHADLDIDVTTGARFHPVEIVLSMVIKFAAVIVIGPALVAVVIFEVVLNGTAMFNHGNFRIPAGADRVLRLVVVTPDMHRVHHSTVAGEFNSNFGFNLPWWDRLFGTYRARPSLGHQGMTIGQADYRDPRRLTLLWLIAMPFRRRPREGAAPDPLSPPAP